MASNSASAPAVPSANGSSSGNGTITDSTGVPGETISAIATPVVAPATEVPSHVGQTNVLDPYFYTQFLSVANLTWSTSQLPGTMLWYTPIHPSASNNILAYVSKIYNTWGGGFDYMLKVAGTGFHAGALALVRLPPNISPQTLTTVEQITAFEWELFDPKQLEMVTRTLIDQKNIMYHYGKLNLDDPTTFGGYLALFVLMPLNTSSTGLNQINVRLFCRASPDFTVAQIIPPTVSVNTEPQSEAASLLFPKTGFGRMLTLDTQVQRLVILPSSIQALTGEVYGQTAASGRNMATSYTPFSMGPVRGHDGIYMQQTPQSASAHRNLKVTFSTAVTAAWNAFYPDLNPSSPDYMYTGTARTQIPEIDYSSLAVDNVIVKQTAGTIKYLDQPAMDGDEYIPPAVTESILLFESHWVQAAENTNPAQFPFRNTQCSSMVAALKGEAQDFIPSGMAYLYKLYDLDTNLPILYLKLYWHGLLTAAPTSTQIDLTASKYGILPVGSINATDPIPTNSAISTNRLMVTLANGDLSR